MLGRSLGCLMAGLVLACSAATPSPAADVAPPTPDDGGIGDGTDKDPDVDEEPGPTCTPPSHLVFQLMPSGASIRPGWTGVSHNIGLPENVVYAVEIVGCDPETCTLCNYRGPVRHASLPYNTQRCLNSSAKECSSNDDCGGSPCVFFYGPGVEAELDVGTAVFPPLELNNIPVCVRMWFERLAEPAVRPWGEDDSPIQGEVNLANGEILVYNQNLRTKQFLGACNHCVGDGEALDGNKAGQCDGNIGLPVMCDEHGADEVGRAFSLDCPPTEILGSVGEFSLAMEKLGTSPVTWTLGEDSPDCARDASKCWCGVCVGTANEPCRRDSDCNESGICGPAPGSKTDSCGVWDTLWPWQDGDDAFTVDDRTCIVSDEARNLGTCPGALYLPGADFPVLRPNTDCVGGGGVIGEQVTAIGKRSVEDEEDPFEDGVSHAKLASLACIPGSGNAQIDSVAGFPGIGIFEVAVQVKVVGGASGVQ